MSAPEGVVIMGMYAKAAPSQGETETDTDKNNPANPAKEAPQHPPPASHESPWWKVAAAVAGAAVKVAYEIVRDHILRGDHH
mgnify:CR=1 FL=1